MGLKFDDYWFYTNSEGKLVPQGYKAGCGCCASTQHESFETDFEHIPVEELRAFHTHLLHRAAKFEKQINQYVNEQAK